MKTNILINTIFINFPQNKTRKYSKQTTQCSSEKFNPTILGNDKTDTSVISFWRWMVNLFTTCIIVYPLHSLNYPSWKKLKLEISAEAIIFSNVLNYFSSISRPLFLTVSLTLAASKILDIIYSVSKTMELLIHTTLKMSIIISMH